MNRIFIKDIVCLYPDAVSDCIDTDLYLLPREKRKLDRYSQISLAISKKIHECNPDFFEHGEDISVLKCLDGDSVGVKLCGKDEEKARTTETTRTIIPKCK